MMTLTLIYALFILLNLNGYRPYLRRVGHALIFVQLTAMGFLYRGVIPDLWVCLGPGLLFFQTYVVNGFYDHQEDGVNGRRHQLSEAHLYLNYAYAFTLFITMYYQDRPLGALMLMALFLVTEFYHNPLVRLKRFGLCQNLLEGIGAALCFGFGAGFPLASLWVGLGFALVSNLKDLDDWRGDLHAGNETFLALAIQRWGWQPVLIVVRRTCLVLMTAAFILSIVHAFRVPSLPSWLGPVSTGAALLVLRCLGLHGERKMLFANLGLFGLLPTLTNLT